MNKFEITQDAAGIFGRIREDGHVDVLDGEGRPATRVDASVYPVNSDLSARYEHPAGIVLTVKDALAAGIAIESSVGGRELHTFTVFSRDNNWGTYIATNPKDAVRQAVRACDADTDVDYLRAYAPGNPTVSNDSLDVFAGALETRPEGTDYISFD